MMERLSCISRVWQQACTLRSWAWEQGLACAFLASVIFSVSALQVKLTGGRVPVLELCIIRSSLSFCTSVGVGTASAIKPLFGHRDRLPLLFMRGLFGTAAISCSYFAVLNLPLGDAVTLAQTRPPITAIMARLLLGEPLGWSGLGGCCISLAGAVLIAHPPFLFGGHADWGPRRLLGTACGLAGPFFGAGVSYCVRRISKREPALVVALWFHIVTISVLLWPLLAGWPQHAAAVGPRDAALLLGISCSSFCAQLLMTRAMQLLPAARASALTFLGVVWAHILGAAVFDEHLTSTTLAGGALIFVGVLLVTLKPGGDSRSSTAAAEGGCKEASGTSGTGGTDLEEAQPLKAQQQQQQPEEEPADEPWDGAGAAPAGGAVPAAAGVVVAAPPAVTAAGLRGSRVAAGGQVQLGGSLQQHGTTPAPLWGAAGRSLQAVQPGSSPSSLPQTAAVPVLPALRPPPAAACTAPQDGGDDGGSFSAGLAQPLLLGNEGSFSCELTPLALLTQQQHTNATPPGRPA